MPDSAFASNDTAERLAADLRDARARTLALLAGLSDAQLMGPKRATLNPLRWEAGHLAWFYEHWILRQLDGRAPLVTDADALYDSTAVAHDTRWDLPLPSMPDTLKYLSDVHAALVERLATQPLTARDAYFYQLTISHEDMHTEAFLHMRQALGYPAPALPGCDDAAHDAGPLPGDVTIPGGTSQLGASRNDGFVFDNEKWAHPVAVAPFRIARAPVTNREYLAFVEAEGYLNRAYWDDAGWRWRESVDLGAPIYWRQDDGAWRARRFDRFEPLMPNAPVMHVSWHEASAYCRYAERRLPTEAEWEMAAACEPSADRRALGTGKCRYPWGNLTPSRLLANLGYRNGCLDTGALPESDSAFGCRQLLGNVWEWTASDFLPYPGFTPDPYKEYSAPWFGSRKVLRGGSWATPARLVRNTWRNFFPPERNDIFAGFRTCAL